MNTQIPIITDVRFFETSHIKRHPVVVRGRPHSSLSIRRAGKISITTPTLGRKLYSDTDSLTYVPAGCEYTTEVIEGGTISIIHFQTSEDSGVFSDIPMVAKPQFPLTFHNLFANAIRRYNVYGCDYFCMSAAYEILCEAEAVFFGSADSPHPRMSHCKEYLDENICDTSLRVSTLAEMCGVSDVYFRREFKRFYGESPLAYIKKKRMELACRLLSSGLDSVTEVAIRCGFDNVSYFSAEFRRMMGTSPSAYRGVTAESVGFDV